MLVRPPKEERDRRAAEKRAMLAKRGMSGDSGARDSEEDAEGEEE